MSKALAYSAGEKPVTNDPIEDNRRLRLELAELKRAHDTLAEEASMYRDLYELAPDLCITADTQTGAILTCNHSVSKATGYTREELLSMNVLSLYPNEEQERLLQTFVTTVNGESLHDAEFEGLRKDGSRFTMSLSVTPVYDADGNVVAGRGVVRDISGRKQAELARQRLMHELDHRVKNALANVQAVADQTARGSNSLSDFLERFSGRIATMTRIHDTLSGNQWQGSDVSQLVALSTTPFADASRRVLLNGAPVELSLEATRSLGMVLHELTTNASKYGALSGETGTVEIHWQVAHGDGARQLRLDWIESGGPEVREPTGRGFGRQLIEESIAHELGGHASLAFPPQGVRCTLKIPLAADDST
jgi:PAS domain S-box-containing protein